MEKYTSFGSSMPQVLRLGLATRGNTHPTVDDVMYAFEKGVNYWNWCGYDDGMCQAVRALGDQRSQIILATQIGVTDWSQAGMQRELEKALAMLHTDWIDIVTLYYVESKTQWQQITSTEGAGQALLDAKQQGVIHSIGLTTHQRPLAAEWAQAGLLDMLMVRYNAAHRGAEQEVFPIATEFNLPVACFTCLRWGALLEPTAGDPVDYQVPQAPEWYRYVLSNPQVNVALMAPDNRDELVENLALLDDWQELSDTARQAMEAHGDRVRNTAGPFP